MATWAFLTFLLFLSVLDGLSTFWQLLYVRWADENVCLEHPFSYQIWFWQLGRLERDNTMRSQTFECHNRLLHGTRTAPVIWLPQLGHRNDGIVVEPKSKWRNWQLCKIKHRLIFYYFFTSTKVAWLGITFLTVQSGIRIIINVNTTVRVGFNQNRYLIEKELWETLCWPFADLKIWNEIIIFIIIRC